MAQPESALSRRIMQAIRARGGWCFKVHASEYTTAGIPDIVICYKGYFVAFETKMPDGRLSEIQEYRIKRIEQAEGIVYVPRSVADAMRALDDIDTLIDDANA